MHVLKPKLLPDSEEYVLEQLSVAEQKLVGVWAWPRPSGGGSP